ncbi:MAG: hypothetical protein AAB269_00535 [Bacteroidota bacterium]
MVASSQSHNVKVAISLPPGKEHIAQDSAQVKQNKEAAKTCLLAADKFIKEGDFEKARVEVERAQKLDPTHPYITAFLDRISYFEDEKKKNAPKVEPLAKKEPDPPPHVTTPKPANPAAPTPPQTQPLPPVVPTAQKLAPQQAAAPPVMPSTPAKKPVDTAKILEGVKSMLSSSSGPSAPTKSAPVGGPPKGELDQMRSQIEELSRALLEEKKAREEIREHQLQGAVNQLRGAMEKAWVNGAPKDAEALACRQLALSLNIPPEVEQSVRREVKIEMYSKAVKEVISKRKLLRSSSSTLEWLRKVYQISMTEYLENESKFLLDLVADQYRGTVLFVAEDGRPRNDVSSRLKSSGYAVVFAQTPEVALEKIEKINPNVILTEQKFPDGSLSGIKFLHVLRTNSKFNFIPCILLCEKTDYDTLKSGDLRTNEAIVKKPVDFDDLTSVMNEKLVQFREYISSLV